MGKCSICSKKGLFLKIKNNMCENCNNLLKELKRERNFYLKKLKEDNLKIEEINLIEDILDDLIVFYKSGVDLTINFNKEFEKLESYKIRVEEKLLEEEEKLVEDKENLLEEEKLTEESVVEENIVLEEVKNENFKPSYDNKGDNIKEITYENRKSNYTNEEALLKKELEKIEMEVNTVKNRIDRENYSLEEYVRDVFSIKEIYIPKIIRILNKGIQCETLNYEKLYEYAQDKCRILQLKTMKSEKEIRDFFNYSVISIKTTGKWVEGGEVIELAAIKVSYGQINKVFQTYINPKENIDESKIINFGITKEFLKDKPTIDDVIPQFLKFIGNDNLIGYDMLYQYKFIKDACSRLYGNELRNSDICVMKLYKQKVKNSYGNNLEEYSLKKCADNILNKNDNIILENGSSTALNEVITVYKIYEKLKK